jgi:hypothetical protein
MSEPKGAKKLRRATWPEALGLATIGIVIVLIAHWAFGQH